MSIDASSLLPDDFLESLKLVPNDRPISLFTRHSIREDADNYNAHHSSALTDEGVALAGHWGALHAFDNFGLYSSPVGRCIDTAFHMFKGKFKLEAQVSVESCLAEPGCFIEDRETMMQVGHVFVTQGPFEFLSRMVSGGFDEHLSVDHGISKLLKHFFEKQQTLEEGGINLHVSHDTILAAFIYRLLGREEVREDDWPRMMEGTYLWFEEKQLSMVWRAKRYNLDVTKYLS